MPERIDHKAVMELLAQGLSPTVVAERLGCHRVSVHRVANGTRKPPPFDHAEILRLYDSGDYPTLISIARKMGVDRSTVRRVIRKAGREPIGLIRARLQAERAREEYQARMQRAITKRRALELYAEGRMRVADIARISNLHQDTIFSLARKAGITRRPRR